jgi:cAMP-binding proteins - catabolite gene activator and regulatory subunit of cAMP-dependent protein kinases
MVMVDATLDKSRLLSKSMLFSQLEMQDLERLVRFAKIKQVRTKQIICHKGEAGNQMFAIIRGRVKISTLSEEGKEKEIVFGILDAGETFGEISLLDGKERSATIMAIEPPSELLMIERRDFIPFLERYPTVAIKLLEVVCGRLRVTCELFEDAVFLNLPSRLAKKLLSLAQIYGKETGLQVPLWGKESSQ